uniref:Ig-like domain-containing protein n=1 Tax=Cyprinus carpio TaxID=7962 RepID=A0A8C2EXI7_CYPCA
MKLLKGKLLSLSCVQTSLKGPIYIAWFKLTSDSLPLCIATQYVGEKPADSIYFNGFKKTHVEMSVNKTLSSLNTLNLEISDSGIFYCGSFLTNQRPISPQGIQQIQIVVCVTHFNRGTNFFFNSNNAVLLHY